MTLEQSNEDLSLERCELIAVELRPQGARPELGALLRRSLRPPKYPNLINMGAWRAQLAELRERGLIKFDEQGRHIKTRLGRRVSGLL